ncbi:MAG: hypothetical protein E7585_04625 [Ruminococcaceae bacterium]|nr:hypothetical protein [Oscillospiraceae bacterium]
MPLAKRILLIGMVPIYVSLFRLLSEIIGQAPFSAATAAYFGRALEYPLSALTVLTAITLIADRASREKTT